MGKGLLMLN